MFTPEQAQGLGMFLVRSLEGEFKTTKKVLAAVPQDKLEFKLGEKGRTARELMWHLVNTEIWFGKGIYSRDFSGAGDGGMPESAQEILERFDKEVPAALERMKTLSGEHLAEPIQFFDMNHPAVIYLSFWSVHTIHHRGQLAAYLRAMNAHVPSIYGGSADEPYVMPASA